MTESFPACCSEGRPPSSCPEHFSRGGRPELRYSSHERISIKLINEGGTAESPFRPFTGWKGFLFGRARFRTGIA